MFLHIDAAFPLCEILSLLGKTSPETKDLQIEDYGNEKLSPIVVRVCLSLATSFFSAMAGNFKPLALACAPFVALVEITKFARGSDLFLFIGAHGMVFLAIAGVIIYKNISRSQELTQPDLEVGD